MRIDILTLFPAMFEPLKMSILKRGQEGGLFEINIVDIRDFAQNKHNKCDDYPFGGGAGMLMMPQPIYSALQSIDSEHKAKRFYMSPQGQTFCHKTSVALAKEQHIILLCGHYEGVDQRILDYEMDGEISIGDYVLTGGELPAMVVVDSLCRQIPGVLDEESLDSESFSNGKLEYPQYTRPSDFMGHKVPDVLLSGNHAQIAKWREEKSQENTRKKRPDLL